MATPSPRRVGQAVLVVVLGVCLAFLLGDLATLTVAALAFVVAVIARVVVVERQRSTPTWVPLVALAGGALIAGRMVLWFGVVGGILAIVILVATLMATGADIG